MDELRKNAPQAIKPFYTEEASLEGEVLYEGDARVEIDGNSCSAQIKIVLTFYSDPKIRFEIVDTEADFGMAFSWVGKHVRLCVENGTVYSGVVSQSGSRILGELYQQDIQEVEDVKSIQFHIFNMPLINGGHVLYANSIGIGRFESVVDGWSVVLDPVHGASDLYKKTRDNGSHAITYVGKVSPVGQKKFVFEEYEDIVSALGEFLSFAFGRFVYVALEVAEKNDGTKVQFMRVPSVYPIRASANWFDPIAMESPGNIFEKFFYFRDKDIWKKEVHYIVRQYVEACTSNISVESKLILIQATLEKIAWIKYVDIDGESRGKNKKYFGDILLRLLGDCKIPVQTPLNLKNLQKLLSKTEKNKPEINNIQKLFVKIRNGIAHGDGRELVYELSIQELGELWTLGLWYLELVVLYLIRYNGKYSVRVQGERWQGDLKPVPWRANDQTG